MNALFKMLVITSAWLLFLIVPIFQNAFEDRGKSENRGTSLFPGFPLFPALAIGLMFVIQRASPNQEVAGILNGGWFWLHVALGLFSLLVSSYYVIRLHIWEKRNQDKQ